VGAGVALADERAVAVGHRKAVARRVVEERLRAVAAAALREHAAPIHASGTGGGVRARGSAGAVARVPQAYQAPIAVVHLTIDRERKKRKEKL
jgi:hypothetical protein